MNVTTPTDTGSMQLDTYMLYSPKTLDAALEAGLQVVINFRASRCPTCKATSEDIIAHQSEIPAGVIILEADYDTTQDLQETYGVKHQTTFSFLNSD